MKISGSIILILFSFHAFAQQLVVKDSASREPIENVCIFTWENGKVRLMGFTDKEGKSKIERGNGLSLSLIIDHIAYSRYSISNGIYGDTTIYLHRKSSDLPTLKIRSHHFKNAKNIITGHKKVNHFVSSTGNATAGSIISIEHGIDSFRISDISFEMKALNRAHCEQAIILYISRVSADTPTTDHLYEPIIFKMDQQKQGIQTIHLNDHINTPVLSERKIFIGMEWQGLHCVDENFKKIFFLRSVASSDANIWFYLDKKQKWLRSSQQKQNTRVYFSLNISY